MTHEQGEELAVLVALCRLHEELQAATADRYGAGARGAVERDDRVAPNEASCAPAS